MQDTNKSLVVASDNEMIPFDQAPSYLPTSTKNTGMENMDKEDFKTPRIILLQALNPEIKTFQGVAFPGNFWHTGMNVNLGESFDFVPALASKRVILWRPRSDNEGGILAFSKDGKTWATGGNQEFRVRLKNVKEPVVWNTGKDVISSRLAEFGTSNPEDPQSAPAATVVYEYLCYLINRPELSPCVLGVSKTGLPNGKSFNTSLGMIARTGKPISCVGVRCFAEVKSNSDGEWTVPNFKTLGFVPKAVYEQAKAMADQYGEYNVEYSQDEVETKDVIDDNINY